MIRLHLQADTREDQERVRETPFFLIERDLLDRNILDFQQALRTYWPNSKLAYSIKTNSLPWLLRYLRGWGILAEAVSDEEYYLALLCGYTDRELVYNGPIKSSGLLQQALRSGAYVNLDSARDLEALGGTSTLIGRVGIRVNVPSRSFDPKDVSCGEDGLRFGWSEENGDFARVLAEVRLSCPDAELGLHLHCNSATRSVEVYRTIAGHAAEIVRKYKLDLSYIDMGGGYFGGVEGKPGPSDYLRAIREILAPAVDSERTALIVEPGSALIGSAAELHTSVLDVKDTSQARIVTTDASRIHIDPLWGKSRYLYTIQAKKTGSLPRQVICGYTCMDRDRIMCLENAPELSVGDRIVYRRVGAYSMTFGGMFIRYLPDVYVRDGDDLELVRRRISVQEYHDIQALGRDHSEPEGPAGA